MYAQTGMAHLQTGGKVISVLVPAGKGLINFVTVWFYFLRINMLSANTFNSLWWLIYAILCFRGEDTKTCLSVITSTLAFQGEDTANKGRQLKRFLPEIFVPSPVKMSLFCLAYFMFSPRKSK